MFRNFYVVFILMFNLLPLRYNRFKRKTLRRWFSLGSGEGVAGLARKTGGSHQSWRQGFGTMVRGPQFSDQSQRVAVAEPISGFGRASQSLQQGQEVGVLVRRIVNEKKITRKTELFLNFCLFNFPGTKD